MVALSDCPLDFENCAITTGAKGVFNVVKTRPQWRNQHVQPGEWGPLSNHIVDACCTQLSSGVRECDG